MAGVSQSHNSGLIGGGLIGDQPAPTQAAGKTRRLRRDPGFHAGWLVTPAALWLLVFLIVPLVSIITFSFWKSTGHGMEARTRAGTR